MSQERACPKHFEGPIPGAGLSPGAMTNCCLGTRHEVTPTNFSMLGLGFSAYNDELVVPPSMAFAVVPKLVEGPSHKRPCPTHFKGHTVPQERP